MNYSDEQNQFIKDNYRKISVKEISKLLNKSSASVKRQARLLNVANTIQLTDSQKQLILKNYKLYNIYDLSKVINISICKIKIFLQQNNLKKKKTDWSTQEINILKQYYGKIPLKQLSLMLDHKRNIGTIIQFCNRHNIKSNNSCTNRYTFNSCFFHVPNLLNSYWAGFLAADGSLDITKKGHRIRLDLCNKDKHWLEKFTQDIEYTGIIRDRIIKNNHILSSKTFYYSNHISLYSKNTCLDLINNFNVTPKKTFTLKPPSNLTKDQNYAYLCGIIDGDGCILLNKPKYGPFLSCSIIGTFDLISWIHDLVTSIIGSNKKKISEAGKIYSICYSYSQAYNLLKFLSNIDCPHMPRKWDKINIYEQYRFNNTSKYFKPKPLSIVD